MTIYQRDEDIFEPTASDVPAWLVRVNFGAGICCEFPVAETRKRLLEQAVLRGLSGLEFVNFTCLRSYRVALNLWAGVAITVVPSEDGPIDCPSALARVAPGELMVWPLVSHIPFAVPFGRRGAIDDDGDISEADAFLSAANLLKIALWDAGENDGEGPQTLRCRGPQRQTSYLQLDKIAFMAALVETYWPLPSVRHASAKRKPAKRNGAR